MRGINTDYYRKELCSMRFVDYTTSSVVNRDPARSGNRTLCSGTAQVVSVRNLHLSGTTWSCVSASLKSRVESRVEVRNTMSRVGTIQEVEFESPNRPYASDAGLVIEQLNRTGNFRS